MAQRDVVVAGRCLITSLGPPSSTYSRTAPRRHGWETDWTSASGRVSVPICKRRRERAVDQPAAPPKTNRASWPSPPLLRLASRPLLGAGVAADSGSLPTADGEPEDGERTRVAAGLVQTTRKTKTMAGEVVAGVVQTCGPDQEDEGVGGRDSLVDDEGCRGDEHVSGNSERRLSSDNGRRARRRQAIP